jgi:hypothetical protein
MSNIPKWRKPDEIERDSYPSIDNEGSLIAEVRLSRDTHDRMVRTLFKEKSLNIDEIVVATNYVNEEGRKVIDIDFGDGYFVVGIDGGYIHKVLGWIESADCESLKKVARDIIRY